MADVAFTIREDEEGWLLARADGHAIFTQAKTWPELRENIREAVQVHFDEDEMPTRVTLHFVRDEEMAI